MTLGSQKPVGLLDAGCRILSGSAAPDKFKVRVNADVPERCMPKIKIHTRSADLSLFRALNLWSLFVNPNLQMHQIYILHFFKAQKKRVHEQKIS